MPESIQKAWEEEDARRKYKDLSSTEIVNVVSSVIKKIENIQDAFYVHHDPDTETDFEVDLQMFIDQVLDSSKLLLKHKIVYRDFAIDLEDVKDDIELEIEEISTSKEKKEKVLIGRQFYNLLNSIIEKIKL